jgi:hypothetical protein
MKLALLAALTLGCTPDYTSQELPPELQLSTTTIDFGEVVVGKRAEIGIYLENTGRGVLHIEECSLDGTTSGDFELIELETDRVEPRESITLAAAYTPDMIGQDFGRIRLVTDDPGASLTEVDLIGFGVEPDIDVDPETLWFGEVQAPDTKTLTLEVAAAGTGTTWISDISFEDDLGVFEYSLPSEVEALPYGLDAGFSFEMQVTYTPTATAEHDTHLLIHSNDPVEPTAAVRLLGNAEYNPDENAAPEVEITDPNYGNYLVLGESTLLAGYVFDLEDSPENLTCAWYADTTFLGNSTPDQDGYVSLVTDRIPVGDVNLTLVAMDTQLETGADSVAVTVWDTEEPVRYTLSGGATVYHYWAVDDDVEISVDGVPIFADNNHTQDNHPPVEFDAEVGSIIHITAWDINECRKQMDTLYLHFGTGMFLPLNEAICAASCDSDPCYDAAYHGPWPNAFLDADYEITIP